MHIYGCSKSNRHDALVLLHLLSDSRQQVRSPAKPTRCGISLGLHTGHR